MPVNRRPGSPNSFFADDEFGLADVGRLVKGLEQEPAAMRHMRLRLQQAQTNIAAVNALDPVSAQKPVFSKMKAAGKKTEESLLPRISLYEATRQDRTTSQAVNSVNRELSDSSVNSYVSRNLNSMGNQTAGLAGSTSTSYAELKKRQESIRGEMGRVRNRALNSAENLYDEEGNIDQGAVKKMHKSQVRFKGLANELTTVSSSLDQAKREGKDPQSRLLSLTKASQNASNVLRTNDLEDQMKSGTGLGALSPKDLKQKEAEASLKLIKAMDELRNSFGKGEDVMEKFAEKAEEAAKELEEVQEAQGMPGGKSKFEDAKVIAGTVMEALNTITNGFQNVAIQQPLQMVANVQGAANIENEKYNMWHGALRGNMTDRMTLGAWETGNAFGNQLAGRQDIVHGAKIAQAAIGTGVGIAQMVAGAAGTAGTLAGNNVVTNVAQGAQTTVSGIVSGVQEGTAWSRQTEKAALRIQGTHAVVNAAKAINHISGQQMQQYRDYTMGLNEAAGQMGGLTGGEYFLNETAGTDFMKKMEKERVGLKEMGALSGQGASQMGSMFKSTQVIDAVRLENLGFGTSDQNMHRMGTLGAAGTGDPSQNLSKVIEEGMKRGLESSKAIDLIVENTARMTEESAKTGAYADTTDFLTKTILNAVDKNNPNKEMATSIAYQTYQANAGARDNIGTSFSGIINVDRMANALGMQNDRVGAALMANMPAEQLNAYRGKSPEELKAFLENRGISPQTLNNMDQSLFKDDKLINASNKVKAVSELAQQSGMGYAVSQPGEMVNLLLKNKDNPEMLNSVIFGKNLNNLSDEDRAMRAKFMASQQLVRKNGMATLADTASLLGIEVNRPSGISLDDIESVNDKSTRGRAQKEKRLGNLADNQAAQQGGTAFGAQHGGAVGVKNLAESGQRAFEKAGQHTEKAWSEAASKTAASFGSSAMGLNKASSKLDSAATKLIAGTDAMKVVSESFGRTVEKLINKIKSGTGEHTEKLEKFGAHK